jgi:hypothetical protein
MCISFTADNDVGVHELFILWVDVHITEDGLIAQQTKAHLRLSLGSLHGSYCSNIEMGGLTWALLSDPII